MSNTNGTRIRTARLELIAATWQLAKVESSSADGLAQALECKPPENWPPPLNDEASQRWTLDMLAHDPDAAGWLLWYFVLDESGVARQLIGNGGFKGKPHNGVCEIGYSVLPAHQQRGYATEAAAALVAWAFTHAEVERVIAETLPELTASIRVMDKCGMQFIGEGNPEQAEVTVRYGITRSAFMNRCGIARR